MHTETNLQDAERAPQWLRKEWINMHRLKLDGVPILGFTWYSLTDQVDWDTALRENAGRVNPPRKPALSPELRSWSMVVVSIYFKDDSHAAAPRRNAPLRENASRHLNIAQRGLRSFTQFC
jgi:hypothetical protein